MKLPKLKNSQKYTGLFVVDFGDYTSVGFTAEEVAELLESEQYRDIKIYSIYKAYPDGGMELKGVSSGIFSLEIAMLFYSYDQNSGKTDYNRLRQSSIQTVPPCRARLDFSHLKNGTFVTALIYPAEYNDMVSRWLLDINYQTEGEVHGGIDALAQYDSTEKEILDHCQIIPERNFENRCGAELFGNLRAAVQR